MTREIDEAIRILKLSIRDSRKHIRFCYDEKGITALDMAIQALEQTQWIPVTLTVGDAVSRQAVLDGLASIAKAKAKSDAQKSLMGRVMFFTERLPSVKPQESCDVPDTNDGDIISKQTVLDTISELNAISFYEAQEDSKECYYELRQAIKDLPPVKQEPNTGHWIEKMDACECPYCHKAWDYCDNDIEDFDYCPKCGAKLSESPTDAKDVIWYSKRNYSEIVVEPQAESEK